MGHSAIKIESFEKTHWSEQDRQHAEVTLAFVQSLMNDHNLELIEKQYAAEQYVQHNRNIKDGIAGVIEYFKTMTKRFPEFAYEVKNVMVDGDFVTLHSHATLNKKHRGDEGKGFNIIDTWRIADGKLVEHWDSVQPLDNFMRFYYWLTGGAIQNRNGVF